MGWEVILMLWLFSRTRRRCRSSSCSLSTTHDVMIIINKENLKGDILRQTHLLRICRMIFSVRPRTVTRSRYPAHIPPVLFCIRLNHRTMQHRRVAAESHIARTVSPQRQFILVLNDLLPQLVGHSPPFFNRQTIDVAVVRSDHRFPRPVGL